MSTDSIIGKHAFYQGLDIYVFNERQCTYRVQVLDGADGFSSTCAGYTPEGIRERALELAHRYLLKRDGITPKPDGQITWEPIRIEIEPNPKADEGVAGRIAACAERSCDAQRGVAQATNSGSHAAGQERQHGDDEY